MDKGLTPALASILLMAITVAAAGTLYTLVQDYMGQAEEGTDTEVPLNINSLQIENCYDEGSNTLLNVRNTASEDAMNASEVAVVLNGTIQNRVDYDLDPEIVNSERVFTINISEDFGDETLVELSKGQQNLRHECLDLD
jgi:flagellin-like protein